MLDKETHLLSAKTIARALYRARLAILTVALTYLVAVIVGMIMVNSGSQFAIAYRDRIVSRAQSGPTLVALNRNDRLLAALLDFGGNLIAVLANALAGLGVILTYPLIAYRGWIGGIVSIDGAHLSRLADPHEAFYYLTTLVLQLIPSILAAGAGVNLGVSYYRPQPYYRGDKWLGLSREALRDALRIIIVALPLLLIASLFEFIMR
jgi:uncharacterized membrane protein SpoIIM required for sporulation